MPVVEALSLPRPAAELVAFWREARQGERLPHRSALDPLALRRWLGDISILELHEGEKRFFIRLHGSNASLYIGPGFHRQYLEDVVPKSARKLALMPYQEAIEGRCPTYSIVEPGMLTGQFRQLERLALPFRDGEESVVSRFLVWVGASDRCDLVGESVYGDSAPSLLARLRSRKRLVLTRIGDDTVIDEHNAA